MYCFASFLPYIYVDINKYCTGSWVYEPKLNLRVSQKLHEYSWITYNTLVQSVSHYLDWAVKHSLFQRSNSSQASPVLSCKLLKCCFDSAKKIVQFIQIKYTYVVLIQINCFRNSWLLILAKEQESVDKYMQVLLFLLVKQHCIICTEELL